jgi:multiple sugar transport system permease protein
MKAAAWGRTGARRATLVFRLFAFAVVCAGALSMLVPFFWMLVTSLKPPGEVFLYPPRWIPSQFRWENYREALTVLPFGRWYLNTIIITLLATVGDVVTASLVGYAFARLRAPGRDFLFMLVISTMLLPHQVTMIPVFLIFRGMHAIDTFVPLWLRSWLGGGAFNIFLCRQFFLTLPLELDDAARIDGCGVVGIYWRIILPLSKPVLAAVTAFATVGKWNEFLDPVIYLQSQTKYVVSIGLRLFQDYQATSYHWLMAAAVVTMLPCLIVFFLAQKSFVQGIATTGLKG